MKEGELVTTVVVVVVVVTVVCLCLRDFKHKTKHMIIVYKVN